MSSNYKLEIVSRLPESNLVEGEDVVAMICIGGKLLTSINTKDNKGIVKVSIFSLIANHSFSLSCLYYAGMDWSTPITL
jgi:hypothetical protein